MEDIKNANLREVPGLAEVVHSGPEALLRIDAIFKQHTDTFIHVVENEFDIFLPDFDFIADHAVQRARQKYPLASQLHSFRIAQRVRWENLCQPLVANGGPMSEPDWRLMILLSVFTFEYVNHISSIMANAYYQESRNLERAASSVRTDFIGRLLRTPDDPMLAGSAQRFDLDPKSMFIVVVVRPLVVSGDNSEEISEVQSCLDNALAPVCRHRLIDLWRGDVICILSASGVSDRDIEKTLVTETGRKIYDKKCRIGVSAPQKDLSSISVSYEDALTALEQASGQHPVMRFNAISAFNHLVDKARNSAYRLKPHWVDALVAEDNRSGGVLLQTLNTYINSRMSAKKTAIELGVHTNTVYQRINKIEETCNLEGLDSPKLIDILVVANLHLQNRG